jgi:hypothetical protein
MFWRIQYKEESGVAALAIHGFAAFGLLPIEAELARSK